MHGDHQYKLDMALSLCTITCVDDNKDMLVNVQRRQTARLMACLGKIILQYVDLAEQL